MTLMTFKTDAEILREVQQELRWDPRVKVTDVGVQVKDGIVTLVGTIGSFASKVAACEAAHRVPGVLDVANDLEVRPPSACKKTDADIAQAVRHALVWDALVPDERIKSTVANGWVTLEGEVEQAFHRTDAAHAVERINGVRGLTNAIVVEKAAIEAAKIRESIEGALKRQTEREAKRIRVQVKDGIVNLAGSVRSWSEKNAVERVASFAPGVRAIENHLTIDPFA